jgi:hypothetical protein
MILDAIKIVHYLYSFDNEIKFIINYNYNNDGNVKYLEKKRRKYYI